MPPQAQEPQSWLGGELEWLAEISGRAIPQVGPFVAAGPIMAALRSAVAVKQ
jgi:hypothetical protein